MFESYSVRANDPALQFYMKNGATIMSDDVVAKKYGYDSTKYLGFQYIDPSLDKTVAMQFATKVSKHREVESVLYVITADTRLQHVIFADITERSAVPGEREILFGIGSSFKIDKISFDAKDGIWLVCMTTTDEGADIVNTYMALAKKEHEAISMNVLFGHLLIEMAQYAIAKKYFEDLLLTITSDHEDVGDIYYNMGRAYCLEKELDEAQDYLEQAYKYQKLRKSSIYPCLVRTLNSQGWVYQNGGEYLEAMEMYSQAKKMCEEKLGPEHLSLAKTLRSMGSNYSDQLKYAQALDCYKRALEIEKKNLPSTHPDIGVVKTDIGDVYRKSDRFDDAFDYYNAAFQIFETTLPEDHPSKAYCQSCIGLVHLKRGDIAAAQECHRNALKSYMRCLPADHINVKVSLFNSTCSDYKLMIDSYIRDV
ncbi:unnamed protein product [Didymodactylos carnosus]|uniref:Uncharacterized protein n=1 Tax=Didymodactylos carnosus TaxID=1234261 RepID=A0A814Y2F7_9BILA|nr:unnamed protein product [Didymodactylos carnosus]CAF3986974.1 unnamed protein product [Didymodactylos carnosus]